MHGYESNLKPDHKGQTLTSIIYCMKMVWVSIWMEYGTVGSGKELHEFIMYSLIRYDGKGKPYAPWPCRLID